MEIRTFADGFITQVWQPSQRTQHVEAFECTFEASSKAPSFPRRLSIVSLKLLSVQSLNVLSPHSVPSDIQFFSLHGAQVTDHWRWLPGMAMTK